MPERVQLSRAKGWRMPANTLKVDRSTRWGNPFTCDEAGKPLEPARSVGRYRAALLLEIGYWPKGERFQGGPPTVLNDVRRELMGKNLACWCRPGAVCHADVLLELANQ